MTTRKDEALKLSEELLTDIELERLAPVSTVRKAARLARLVDDVEASSWLSFEIGGYPSTGDGSLSDFTFSKDEWNAVLRSGRSYTITVEGKATSRASGASLAKLQSQIEVAKMRLNNADSQNAVERDGQQKIIVQCQNTLDKVVGSIYQYVVKINIELRFGAVAATAFEHLRDNVDTQIAALVPDALPILSTALENAQTDNPEQWKNAAKASRDLIIAAANALRAPGPDKEVGKGQPSIKMGVKNYVNRLVDWIEQNSESKTKKILVKSDLEHLGERLDAVTGSGNKGAHARVSKTDASRYIVGTYLLLGDILSLSKQEEPLVGKESKD